MTPKMDKMLEFIALDDDSHSIEEISKELGLSMRTCRKISNFLMKYDFVRSDGMNIRIDPKIRDLLVSTRKPVLKIV